MSRITAFILTFLISMLPIVELRGAIPAAAVKFDLTFLEAYPVAVLGNVVPVPFIILYFKYLFKFFEKVKFIGTVFKKVHDKAVKNADKIEKYAVWGLFIFVAIPFPGTGAWTGAVIASVLEMRLRKAFPVILMGVMTSGLIMGCVSYGLIDLITSLI